jgi:hypothetical protein
MMMLPVQRRGAIPQEAWVRLWSGSFLQVSAVALGRFVTPVRIMLIGIRSGPIGYFMFDSESER